MTTSSAGQSELVDAFDVERPSSMTLLPPDRAPRRGSRWPDAGAAGGGGGSAEFEDLATVRRFAEQISALGDGSDYTQTIAACAGLQDMIRDFGGDMNKSVAAFVDAATAVARSGQELTAQAVQVAGLAVDMSGESGPGGSRQWREGLATGASGSAPRFAPGTGTNWGNLPWSEGIKQGIPEG